MSATINNFDDIVFENRNKEYGAYVMRRNYGRSIVIATATGIAIIALLVSIPVISAWVKKLNEKEEVLEKETKTELAEVKKTEEPPPPPPPPPPVEPPKVQEIQFTEPVITNDPIEEPPPVVEDLTNKNVGDENVESEITDFTPPEDNSNNQVVEEPPPPQIFTIVEQMPEFPNGGEEGLLKYLAKNIKYPEIARDANTQGTIFLTFVVNETGQITDPKILRGLTGPGAKECANEAIRVVNSMPAWKPGKQNGKAVKVQYQLPVKFTMR